jgi:hypothetical protein
VRFLQPLGPEFLLAEAHQPVKQLVAAADHVQTAFVLMFLEDTVQAIFQFRHMTSQTGGLRNANFSLAPGDTRRSSEKLMAAIEISNAQG